jgi:uncharacterized repeat protein (TIGR01451 family)
MFFSAAPAAVTVQINSGDPAFPFPQFLPYTHADGNILDNLGTRNPAGVTHAEMEKSIRDAYQIMMNRANYYENIALNGTRYIKYASNPDCSEGTGYAMLAAAMMADKVTFDGLWLFTHDYAMNNVVRYRDGSSAPSYSYSTLPGWTNAAGGNSAADGDFDIALALMIAHRQWGELMGIKDSRGNNISYKADFLKVIKGLTDTLAYKAALPELRLLSGDIGFDGYFKGGDSWTELTGWARSIQNLVSSIGITKPAEANGPQMQHIDYAAPAYFRQFADYMRSDNANAHAWNISQFERAEASSDWLIGKLMQQNERNIPVAGWVEMKNDTAPEFTSFSDGEDFRAPWRTILNYVWHGNPGYSWDPVRHVVVRNRPNTFELDAGKRFSRFLWDRRQAPWNGSCEKIIGEGDWWGPSMLKYHYSPQGGELTVYPLNWLHGTGSPSAVAARDTNLMAEMYRQAELEWDVAEPGDRYLTSTPQYFHGFFRLLGMNVLTGNHHAPMNMKRGANMKVYLDIDKTYAFENDTITYTVDYRNYGAEEAKDVRITSRMHSDMVFISATGGGTLNAASNTVIWNIGSVSGFKTSAGVKPTTGAVSFKVIIPKANAKRYENKVDIACSNGAGWTSNEYPNKISSVMKRNGVDIARRALRIDHSVYRDTVNPGMSAVYTIGFENSAEAGWMNGGRPGVNFSYAHEGTASSGGSHTFMIRAFNDAHEAYIDYGNYRLSYFLFDNNYRGLGANGWNIRTDILYVPDAEKSKFKPDHENITPGEDAKGKWNQRLILQIADVLDPARTDTNWGTMAAPTQFLINYSGLDQRVHRGISTPFKGVWAVYAGNYANRNWGADWSYNARASGTISNDAMASWGYPVTPDFTESADPDYPGKPVTGLHRKLCGAPPSTAVDNVLIEEWDGYTWRRVFGNGPLPGREVNNVVIRDTLPQGVTFQNFIQPYPMGVAPTISGRVITWQIDKLLVGEKGKIQYSVRADTPAVFTDVRIPSRAWASADREAPMLSTTILVVTRDSLPPPPPAPTTLYKRANKNTFLPGDTIAYTIAYKQTHGYPAVSASADQWAGANKRINSRGDTIVFNNTLDMSFTPSNGTNGTLSGTLHPVSYDDPFYIFARRGNQRAGVELKFERIYVQAENFPGIEITVASNGAAAGRVAIPMAGEEPSINYKIVFQNDSLLLWMGDTAAFHPFFALTGIAVQQGAAGVRYEKPNSGSARLTGWKSHFDLAYDVVIRDTVPAAVTYIAGSAAGAVNTGALAPRQLTGAAAGNVITWPVVSGLNNPLGANDSLTVTWRGVVDTSKTNFIINTAYADLSGYPKDSVGAQLRSRFSLVDIPDPDPPDTLQGGLTVRADPPGCMFAGSISVTLSSLPGAAIWYTTNGMAPDSSSFVSRRYTPGQPLELFTATTLKAAAYADGFEPSEAVTHVYEPINTVPAYDAFFYDNVGDGLAHGVKILVTPVWAPDMNRAVIAAHPELISLSGLSAAVDSLYFSGDTAVLRFKGAGIDPPLNARLIITVPPLPDSRYENEHGYLAARDLGIRDGVAPVIAEAVYYPTLGGDGPRAGINGDTLIVTFNKFTRMDTANVILPFVLSYEGGIYELELKYVRHDGGNRSRVVFAVNSVVNVAGPKPVTAPEDGDSIRIKANGEIKNIYSNELYDFAQYNENNKAVALKIRYPDLKYVLKAGPSPSSDTVHVWIALQPHLSSAFSAMNPKAVILDRVGGRVAVTGKNLKFNVEGERYALTWDGCNQKGRKVGTGAYQILATVSDQDGNKKTLRAKIYILRKK